MLIVDAQQNIAFNAQQLGRDYLQWAWIQHRAESQRDAPPATTSLNDNLLGRVAVVIAAITVVAETSPARCAWHRHTWRADSDARALARWQLDYYQRLADESDRVQLLQTRDDLAAALDSWDDSDAVSRHRQGLFIQLKGAAPIAEARQLEDWLEYGVRGVAPAFGPNRYVASEFSPLGYELLEAMAGFDALLDIAGMSDRAAAQALERYPGPIIASHSSPRHIGAGARCLPDELILRLAERDGVMGVMMYNRLLRRDWHPADPRRLVNLSRWVDAVDQVCQVTGSSAHVGLGSDIDGGYAYSELPLELDTSCDLWLLRRALGERGFSDAEAAAILGGNMLRKIREALPDG